jgi:hypothetical protein
MTHGFQQQKSSVNFSMPKSAAQPQQVGRKLIDTETRASPLPRPPEPRTFG